MTTYLEVRAGGAPELVALGEGRTTIGRAPGNDVVVLDPAVSKLHAVLETYASEWCIRDLDSANGTFVNGRAVTGETRLRPGDEIVLGGSRLIFRSGATAAPDPTERADAPPVLTRREKDVLVALCRPLRAATVFAEPASIRDIARELVVTEAAVKFHLANLYDKFGLHEAETRRRVHLANEAVRRRAIALGDLARPSDTDGA
jgi:hypothetical protein